MAAGRPWRRAACIVSSCSPTRGMTTSALARPRHHQPRDLGMQERHVTGDGERGIAGGGGEAREDAAERAVVGIDVGDHRQPQERVELGGVRHDQHIVHHRGDGVQHALDDAPAAELEQRLGLAAHARALAAGLDDAGHPHAGDTRARRRGSRGGGSTVTSSTVDGSPPAVAPPSSDSSMRVAKVGAHLGGGGRRRPPREDSRSAP